MAQRAALGRGLSALLGENSEVAAQQEQRRAAVTPLPADNPASVNEIPTDRIIPNPYQPRLTFDEDTLEELAESIRNLGIIQPLTLRRMPDGRYQIISGERRFRASLKAGLASVPAYIRKADDAAMLEMAIVENIQRENLDAIETALGFQRLIDECDLTQEAMALRVGKKRATITNFLRLLKLPPEVQKAIKDDEISAGHARALLSLESPEMQKRLCRQAVNGGWSVRTLEEKIRRILEKPEKKTVSPIPERFAQAAEKFRSFGGTLSVKDSGRGSSITVRFRKKDDVEKFLQAVGMLNPQDS